MFSLTVAGLIGLGNLTSAPVPKLVREIDLNEIIHESGSLLPSTHSTRDISFSPNEKWIAVGVGLHHKPGPRPPGESAESHVLVIPFNDNKDRNVQIDPGTTITKSCLVWSPDSSALAVAGVVPRLYSIPGGKQWNGGQPDARLGIIKGFVDADHGLAYQFEPQPGRAMWLDHVRLPVYTFDQMGHVAESWLAPGFWIVYAVHPGRHLLIVTDVSTRESERVVSHFVFNYLTKQVIQNWPAGIPFHESFFAEDGKTVCSVGDYGREAKPAQCWDIQSGEKIAEFRKFTGGLPAAVATQNSRIVLSHIRNYRGITEEYDMHSYDNRVVWDFRTGKEIAAWVPKMQATETGFRAPNDKHTEGGPFAISPTGRYLAEGGNGVLRIYELQ